MKKTMLFVFSLSLLCACNNSSLGLKDKKTTQDVPLNPPSLNDKVSTGDLDKSEKADTVVSSSQYIPQGSVANQNKDWEKKIIKTATLKLEVKNFKTYGDIVHKAAKQYGGYVADEEQNQSQEKIESTISIKVPVEQFESLMSELPSSANKMIEKKITTEDVTGEVVDTKSRLHAKEQMRLKYLEFLKQSKNMEDVLKVQDEINGIQEEMESASGRINYLSHQSAYSTINLTFYQPLPGFVPNDNPGFFTRSIIAFKAGFQFIADMIIGFISIWPLLVFVIAGWMIVKKYRINIATAKQKI